MKTTDSTTPLGFARAFVAASVDHDGGLDAVQDLLDLLDTAVDSAPRINDSLLKLRRIELLETFRDAVQSELEKSRRQG